MCSGLKIYFVCNIC